MRKYSLYILIIMLFWPGIHMHGQYKVAYYYELPPESRQFAIPDVMGKVLVSDKQALIQSEFLLSGDSRQPWSGTIDPQDTIPAYPGWPVNQYGMAERGGVYGDLDHDDDLEIIYIIGSSVYAYNFDGSPVAGWPVNIQYISNGAPSYGDVDGDGYGEVVVITHRKGSFDVGKVYAFERNGTNVFGFPVETEGGPVRTPVLADIDGNGSDEIILSVRDYPDGFVHIYRGNGSPLDGWPVRLFNVPASSPAVGDINGDGVPEIVAQSYTHLYAMNSIGSALEGFPYAPGNNRAFSHSTPVLADLDGDNNREIIFGDINSIGGGGMLHVVKNDGSSFPGYPKETGFWIYSPPSIGDVNGDTSLDIIVADWSSEINPPVNKVYGWDAQTAEPLPGYPVDSVYGVFGQILLVDLDGDQELDLMFDSNIGPGLYFGLDSHGDPLDGWPLYVSGTTHTINPFVADLNGDGMMDISGGSFEPSDSLLSVYTWDPSVIHNDDYAILSTLQYNTRHNGVYGDYLMVGVRQDEPAGMINRLEVLPNPVSSQIHIFLEEGANAELVLKIYDVYGRLAYKAIIPEGTNHVQIDASGWPQGTYIARMNDDSKVRAMNKFIISK